MQIHAITQLKRFGSHLWKGAALARDFMEPMPPYYNSEIVGFHTNEHERGLGWQLVLRPSASESLRGAYLMQFPLALLQTD